MVKSYINSASKVSNASYSPRTSSPPTSPSPPSNGSQTHRCTPKKHQWVYASPISRVD